MGNDYQNLVCKYRWEFLRRNKDYIKDYNSRAQQKKNPKRGKWRLLGYERKELNYWLKKYGIGYPLKPIRKFEKLKGRVDYLDVYPAVVFDSALFENVDFETNTINYDGIIFLDVSKIKGIKVSVNLTKKREDILNDFRKTIDGFRRLLRQEKNLRNERVRFDEYKRYLQVYDLVAQGWTRKKVANKFYKGDVERGDLNYAKRKVKRDYDRCMKLINGGYRQIR